MQVLQEMAYFQNLTNLHTSDHRYARCAQVCNVLSQEYVSYPHATVFSFLLQVYTSFMHQTFSTNSSYVNTAIREDFGLMHTSGVACI